MNTKIISVLDVQRDFEGVRLAAKILRAGGLVALPTETVYGLAANALEPNAITKIFKAKGRPQDNPLIVHVADVNEIDTLVREFPAKAKLLARHFWPGPLTMVLPKSARVPDEVSAGLSSVAVRMPSHPVILAVIREAGLPLAAPSANRSGSPSPTCAKHCIEDLSGQIDLIIDGGDCAVGVESTVISLLNDVPLLLRPGAVTPEELRGVLGELHIDPAVAGKLDNSKPASSPGMKYRHYAPAVKLTLLHGDFERFSHFVAQQTDCAALVFDGEDSRLAVDCVTYGSAVDPLEQGRRLFSALRELDTLEAGQVFARVPKPQGMGLAVYNRLLRASGFNEYYLNQMR